MCYVYAGVPCVSRIPGARGAALSHRCCGGFSLRAMAITCARRHTVGRVWIQDDTAFVWFVARDGVEVAP